MATVELSFHKCKISRRQLSQKPSGMTPQYAWARRFSAHTHTLHTGVAFKQSILTCTPMYTNTKLGRIVLQARCRILVVEQGTKRIVGAGHETAPGPRCRVDV